MAQSFNTISGVGTKLARTSISLLAAELVLGRLVHRDAEGDFGGEVGTIVNIKMPNTATEAVDIATKDAKGLTGNSATTEQEINSKTVPLPIDSHFAHKVAITAKEKSLDLENFASQVVAPQVLQIGEKVEKKIAALMNKVIADQKDTGKAGLVFKPNLGKNAARKAIVEASTIMDENNVPAYGRVLVVSPRFYAELLNDELFVKVNESGSTEALRRANVGNILGFDVYKSNFITGGAIAMTREAFALVVRAPYAAEGGAKSGSQSYQGYAMRWTQDFDNQKLRDLSILDVFSGAVDVDSDVRAVGIKLDATTSG
ncbi:P22 phage major capsid protein family protein [Streptomyces sp. NPDC059708]|uniref:P22 phage major capsid protein family protein n=1 Tax=Streptomyces sp. NPDC059708 TaxID=3346916 RepID=UPI0036C7922B